MNEIALARIIHRGTSSLAASLETYWPTWGNNEIAEANQVLHIGRAFLDENFLGLAEVHQEGGASCRFDLLAIEPTEGTLLVGEFKRIYNRDQVVLVCDDAERVIEFSPIRSQLTDSGLVIKEQWGVVGGTTWLEDYVTWFLDKDVAAKDPTGDAGNLNRLWKILKPMKPLWRAYPLLTKIDPVTKKIRSQWFVFALFKL